MDRENERKRKQKEIDDKRRATEAEIERKRQERIAELEKARGGSQDAAQAGLKNAKRNSIKPCKRPATNEPKQEWTPGPRAFSKAFRNSFRMRSARRRMPKTAGLKPRPDETRPLSLTWPNSRLALPTSANGNCPNLRKCVEFSRSNNSNRNSLAFVPGFSYASYGSEMGTPLGSFPRYHGIERRSRNPYRAVLDAPVPDEDSDEGDVAVLNRASVETPAVWDSLHRSGFTISQITPIIFRVGVKYSRHSREKLPTGQGSWNFDTSVSPVKSYYALSQQKFGADAPDHGVFLNVSEDQGTLHVEGFDVPRPSQKMEWNVSLPSTTFTTTWFNDVNGLVGKINNNTFKGIPRASCSLPVSLVEFRPKAIPI